MKCVRYILIALLFISSPALATITVIGNAGTSSSFTFTVPVTTKVYDHATGTLFLGLAGGAAFSLNKIARFNGSTTPVATAIGTNVSGATIEFLTLSTFIGNTQPNLVFSTLNTNPFSQTNFNVANSAGTLNNSGTLNDANGNLTAGIVGLAASDSFVFAPVRPNGGNFGATGSGIALASLTPSTSNTVPMPPPTISVLDATTGSIGNLALPLNATSVELRGAGTDPVIFQTGSNTNQVVTLWDEQLQRVYFGFRISTDVNAGEVGKAVTLGFTNTLNDALTLVPITPDSAISAGAINEFIVTKQSNQPITIKKMGIMHTSTGPSYLIIQGGLGNTVWALPLVDNPLDSASHGTLANKNSPLSPQFTFTQPATAAGELANDTDTFAIVGATTVPLAANGDIFDMVVSGDTVYISIATATTTTSDSGIFYSQALFDQDGKIAGWTPWTKRAFPPTTDTSTGISFFDVDAVTSTIWAVDGQTQQIVRTNSWSSSNNIAGSLLNTLNTTFGNTCKSGSCSVLDLDQATRGFSGNTHARYALFGGHQIVAFALVSRGISTTVNSPQIITSDYSSPSNYVITNLPGQAGTVTSLEYSRRLLAEGSSNYFFAGTEQGLYAFADNNGNGFLVSQLGSLNAPPFNGRWHKITTIPGSIIDVKSDGSQLYVLTREFDAINLFKSTLYSISYTTNINTMFASPVIIAQTMTSSLTSTRLFTAIQFIENQLVVATNRGLYRSTTPGGVALAINQTTAGWTFISNNTSFFNGIAGIDSSLPITQSTTIWPFSIQTQSTLHTFENGSIDQLNGTTSLLPYEFIPLYFISKEQLTNPAFAILPAIHYFWTDGNRRLFVTTANGCCKGNSLFSLPYDTLDWRISSPNQTIIITPIVTSTRTINWVKQIGATGLLLLGTSQGIISLE
ncbi:MAG: hypothetical protein ACOYT8_04690 [Candidatus Dependentiae bacterium]